MANSLVILLLYFILQTELISFLQENQKQIKNLHDSLKEDRKNHFARFVEAQLLSKPEASLDYYTQEISNILFADFVVELGSNA